VDNDRIWNALVKYLIALLLFPVTVFAQLSATAVQTAGGDTGAVTAASFTITLGSTPVAGNAIALGVISGSAEIKVSSTNTRWMEVQPNVYNTTTPSSAHLFIGYPDASAGTVITVAQLAGTNVSMAGLAAEFTGKNLEINSVQATATGASTTPAITINASNRPNTLLIAVISSRGTFSAQTAVYSAPTNGFTFADGSGTAGTGQRNTTVNTSNADRVVSLLVKLVTDGASVSTGVTIGATNQWATLGTSLAETIQGFFIN
jgi:hypothetical protein